MSKWPNEWTMKHGLIQCMGCRGFGPAEGYTYHKHNDYHGNAFPYCTDECRKADGAEPRKEE